MIKGLLLLTLGLIGSFVTGVELMGYMSGEPIEFTTTKFGTLSGWGAITAQGSMFVLGLVFIAMGVIMLKRTGSGSALK